MSVWSRIVGCVVAAGLVVGGAVAAVPASAAEQPVIYAVTKEYAPKGKKGAIILPWISCSGSASNRATIRKVGSSKAITATWKFGLKYVRVAAGKYRVAITATCRGATATKTSTVTVRKEKDSNTVTRAEFNRINKGMTLNQVKKIVGTRGVGGSSYRYLDRRGGFRWAEIWLSRGRVAGKSWVAELGDNGVR